MSWTLDHHHFSDPLDPSVLLTLEGSRMPRRLSPEREKQVQGMHLDVSTYRALHQETPAITTWHVAAYADTEGEDGDDENPPSAPPVGIATMVTCDMGSTEVSAELAGQGVDLLTIADAVIDPCTGGYRPDVLPGAQGDLIIGKQVFVTLKWRGYGLGSLILAESIHFFGSGFGVAVVHPAPTGLVHLDDAQRVRAVDKLQALWSELGFRHASGEVFALEFDSSGFEQKRVELRKRFGLDH